MNFKIIIHNFIIKTLPLSFYFFFKGIYNKFLKKIIIKNWELSGKPLPPPHQIKQETIKYYKDIFGYNILIETGTFWGDMIAAQKSYFKEIHSIELSEYFFKIASKRFARNKHIKIYNGDSSELLPSILQTIQEPVIFWLDGHFSGGKTAQGSLNCPVIFELEAINSFNQNCVILIDDYRCFDGTNDYPTLDQIKSILNFRSNKYSIKIENDIIQIFPNEN